MIAEDIKNSELKSYIDAFTEDDKQQELLNRRYLDGALIDDLCVFYEPYNTYGIMEGRLKINELFREFEDFASRQHSLGK
jgi:hypothetical protein